MTPDEYEEVEVTRIPPDWADGAQGTHTVNQAARVTVYDCDALCRK